MRLQQQERQLGRASLAASKSGVFAMVTKNLVAVPKGEDDEDVDPDADADSASEPIDISPDNEALNTSSDYIEAR